MFSSGIKVEEGMRGNPATPACHINYLASAVGRDEKLAGEG
jgi:hypothetical protein